MSTRLKLSSRRSATGLKKGDIDDPTKVWSALKSEAIRVLEIDEKPGGILLRGKPTVVLMIGVNGAGKTTTIGKLATKFRDAGLKVVLAAGDTFRAAAVQQLVVWGQRVGCEVVKVKTAPTRAASSSMRSSAPKRRAPIWSSRTPQVAFTRRRT